MADGILWQLVGNTGANWGQQFNAGYDRGQAQAAKSNRKSILESLTTGPDGNLDIKSGVTQLIKAGDPEGAMQIGQLYKAFQPETTDEIKEYNLYQQQARTTGQQPKSFTDWKIAIKTASAPKINNVVNTGDNQYAKTIGELNAKQDIDIQKAGMNAISTIGTLRTMDSLLNDPKLYTGAGAETALKIKGALKGLGVNAEGLPEGELFRALSNKLVLDATGGSLGVAISNADRDFLQQTNANLSNSMQGNKQIVANALKLEERKQQIAKWAREYKAMNKGQIDDGFQDFLAKKAEQNPLFPQAQQRQTQDPIELEMRKRGLLK